MELAETYFNRYWQAQEIDRLEVILEYRSKLDMLPEDDRVAAHAYMAAHWPLSEKIDLTEMDDSFTKAEALLNKTLLPV
jgi:hypothetical protein